jgi:hypothetical protein
MNQKWKIFINAIVVLLGGTVLFALFWFAYVGVTLLMETTIFQDNPQELPQDTLRNVSALLAGVLCLALMRTRLHDIIKGMFLLAGVAVIMIALVLRFYLMIWIAVILAVLISGIIIWILFEKRKSWIYYYSVAIGVIIAILYAWPR